MWLQGRLGMGKTAADQKAGDEALFRAQTEHAATNSRMSLSMPGHQNSLERWAPGWPANGDECPHCNTWDRVPTGTNVPTATPGTVSQRGWMSPLQHLGPCPNGDECPYWTNRRMSPLQPPVSQRRMSPSEQTMTGPGSNRKAFWTIASMSHKTGATIWAPGTTGSGAGAPPVWSWMRESAYLADRRV